MGCFAGCLAYFIRGMWFSPKKERFYGGVLLLKRRAPVLGGNTIILILNRKFRFVGRIVFVD